MFKKRMQVKAVALVAALLVGLMSQSQAAPERSGGKEAGFSYNGKYATEVKYLLGHEQCPQWATGDNEDGSPLKPPQFNLPEDGAIRDTYVAAATTRAWAAEAYARLGEHGKAQSTAQEMMTNLKQAADLCGGNSVGNKRVVTEYITCEWLRQRDYSDVEE